MFGIGEPDFDWKIAAVKAVRGALFAGLLVLVYDPNVVGIANYLPEPYRVKAALALAAVLPALRNTLKQRVGLELGGLL